MELGPIGFGAFKIGRNQGIKYAVDYALPDQPQVDLLLNGVLDAGINYIDTAPAYGLSEERIGTAISHRKSEFILSTKVGEVFDIGKSRFDFSAKAVRDSVERSLQKLKVRVIDLLIIHSDGNDLAILHETEVVETIQSMKNRGDVRAIGFSGKTVPGATAALEWADAIMVEYHLNDRTHEEVIAEAGKRDVGIIVKKGLASGRLAAREAIPFVLASPNVTSMVIGGLDLDHIRENLQIAASAK